MQLEGRCGQTSNTSAVKIRINRRSRANTKPNAPVTNRLTNICSHVVPIKDKAFIFSLRCCLSLLSYRYMQANVQHTRTHPMSLGPTQHLLTMCLMIINEPSWVEWEALSHLFYWQEEDWEPQGHSTVSITLPNDSSCSLSCMRSHTFWTQSDTKSPMPGSCWQTEITTLAVCHFYQARPIKPFLKHHTWAFPVC